MIEIGPDDLAMDRTEAKELLANADVTLRPDEVDAVHARTEGWPAGLYLAGLASKGRRHVATAGFAFRGDDVLMAAYLRSEILGPLPASTVSFLTRTSVLTQLSGPLCDAVLGSSGSQATLETLEASNLLLVPLDRRRGWYRYHQLLGDLLRAELERREPALVPTLHRRAATWLEEHNLLEDAINHAQRCGDPDVVARLVTAALQPSYAAGRAERALGWLEWFRAEGLIDRYREVAVLGALIEALSGHPASAERWTAAAELEPPRAMDGAALEGPLAYLRCVLCRNGTTRMRADARLAQRVLRAEEAMRAAAMLFEGLSYVLDGLPEHADPLLAHAYDVSLYVGAMPTAATAAAQRSLIAAGRDEWAEAEALAERAVDIVESGHLQDYPAAGHAFVAAAHAALHRNDRQTAADHLARAARVRHLLTYAVPASSIVQLEIARVYLALADPAGARTVLRELRDVLHQRPDLGVVPDQADQLQQQLNALHHGPAGASLADRRRAPAAALPRHAPLLPGDRRAAPRVPAHGQEPGHLGLSQGRRDLAERGDPPGPRDRAPRRLTEQPGRDPSRSDDACRRAPRLRWRHAGTRRCRPSRPPGREDPGAGAPRSARGDRGGGQVVP